MEIQKRQSGIIGYEEEMGKQLSPINFFMPYPKEKGELISAGKKLKEWFPDLTPEKLKSIIDRFGRNEIEWDKKIGILNISKQLNKRNRGETKSGMVY